jgi:outer membrane protein assembly factor BamB
VLRILKIAGVGLLVLAGLGVALYQFFGLRVVLDGGGTPHLRFVESSASLAARVEEHRRAGRVGGGSVGPAPAADEPATTPPTDRDAVDPGRGATSADRSVPHESNLRGVPSGAVASVYWTDFRGPKRDGEYREQPLDLLRPADSFKPIWKQPSGAGYASFTIARGRAFTIEQRGAEEVVAAYDVATGRELWTNSWPAEFREWMGGDGPRTTPTWADGRVFALGAEGELRSLDEATGRQVWRTNILKDAGVGNLQWGMSASPLVVDDVVVVQPGAYDGQSVAAYDRHSGRRVWTALDDHQSYASPMLVTLAGVRQILVFSSSRLVAIRPDGGSPLWEYPWPGPNRINAAQPLVIGDNRVFVSSGYGTGAAVVEITRAASGFAVREVWRNVRMKNRFASSVLHEGFIYGLDESILACLDAATGELEWKGGRYGYGQVLLSGGHLIVLTEEGELAIVRASPSRHDELARVPVLRGKTWNVPAIGGGFLLVRNLAEMAAFDLRVRTP